MGKVRVCRIVGRNSWILCAALLAIAATAILPSASHADMSVKPPGQGGPPGSVPAPSRTGASGQPALKASPVPVAPPKPFQLDPAILGALTQALLQTDTVPAYNNLEGKVKDFEKKLHKANQDRWYYQEHARKCSNKTFTTEDQQKAGCKGTDTLNQCSEKLFRYCFTHSQNSPTQSYPKSKEEFLQAASALEAALKEYKGKLNLIPIIK